MQEVELQESFISALQATDVSGEKKVSKSYDNDEYTMWVACKAVFFHWLRLESSVAVLR